MAIFGDCRTDAAQKTEEELRPKVRFPKKVKYHRGEATIYGKTPKYKLYRVAYYMGGTRLWGHFKSFADAKDFAEKKAKEISDGQRSANLTSSEALDSLAALDRLEAFRLKSGRNLTLLGAVSQLVEQLERLEGKSLSEVVDGYLKHEVMVKREKLKTAVEEFIKNRQPRTEPKDGERPQTSSEYERHVAAWLTHFADSLSGSAVCDITKDHLTLYMRNFDQLSAKSRNDRRNTIKMFLTWAVKRDYLSVTHRLFEAEGMANEKVEASDIEFYTPGELDTLLTGSGEEFVPVIALGCLAGLRMAEIMRLDWSDVWRIQGHIEISARNAKTRQRRLIDMCPRLEALLAPYRNNAGKIWKGIPNRFYVEFPGILKGLKVPMRRNGFRHGFVTYHFALHANENLTAKLAGNSPAMIHAHYKGLATKSDAEKWFNGSPM